MTAMMIEAAVRGLMLAALVGAGLRVLRVTNVPVRKAAWTLVLLASAAMPLLMRWSAVTGLAERFAWVVPMHRTPTEHVRSGAQSAMAPGRHADAVAMVAAPARRSTQQDAVPVDALPLAASIADAAPVVSAMASAPPRRWHCPPVTQLIPMIYLAVSGALLLRLLWGLGAAWWLWARAEEVSPLVVPEPHVRMSERVPSPVTIGSGIVLPVNYTQWGYAKLRVVLAHERSHVRQGDFYLKMLAGLYTAIFWFSPLGWWLKRTLSALGEAISDRAGMQAAPSRSEYAGVLLEFAATTGRAMPGVAMARSGNLSQRMEQLLNESLFRKAFAEGRRRALVSLLLVPAAIFAVTALVRVPGAAAQSAPASPTATAPAPSGILPDEQPPVGREAVPLPVPAPAQQPESAPQSMPPVSTSDEQKPTVLDLGSMPDVKMPEIRVVVPKIPEVKIPDFKVVVPKVPDIQAPDIQAMVVSNLDREMSLVGPSGSFYLMPDGGTHGYAYFFSANGDSWAIVEGQGRNFSMGEGSTKQQLDLAQRMAKGPFLWFTHEGKSYIVADAATVARIRALYEPMKELGHQQEALGVQQKVLGRMESELARQERTNANVQVPDLSKEMADAEAALNSLKSEQGQMLSEEKLAEMQRKLAEVEAKLGSLEVRSAMQNNFGERMRALGEQQRQLGEQQRQLGEQQKKMAEDAERQVESILRECLQSGKATPVK